ncbi:hypothetical protein [Pedosphaera parvula]|uniref:Uncharacterized protein n=1 Tax=Pedosphaera parvula (strain Ellin514) TaxID=320771 RepID=B9XNT2_PEDPL|nr:hypothetical protein [Pedosphaera parvula]EEF58505.1 hypothetical protein Cflav_PD1232 [Pedosphaera parvula Ellin514]
MSTSPEAEFNLEKLFLPAWAQEAPAANRYEKYTGNETSERPERRGGDRGGRRPEGRGGPGGPRREGGGGRPGGAPRGPGQGQGGFGGEQRGPRREGGGGFNRGPGRGPGQGREERGGRFDRGERREAPLPLPELTVTYLPDDKGVDSLSRQIKMSGRSFPLFDIAQMILQKPERHLVRFEVKKKQDGTVAQPLFLCAIDDSLWLSEEEAVAHVMTKHFGMFYQAEKTPTEPPKGTYTFVAQCGISGVILGPPNYHDYQNQLRRLHAERFSRMPFDMFKSRVKIVKDEATVKKWVEDQSFKTEYICLNVPEAGRLASREDVDKHFREVHLPNIIKQVEKHTMTGVAARALRAPALQRLLRSTWEDQRRFPLQIATILSQQFAGHGLQFFKVNKTVTHVSVARPHYLDLDATPVSEQVKKIVQFIDSKPKCTRKQLVEALAPTPKVAPATPPTVATAEAAPASAPAEGAAPAAAPTPAEPATTPEQAAVIGDLHWLIHQGHVIEFANGILETAKKPVPKPPKPAKAKPAEAAAVAGGESAEGQAATSGEATATQTEASAGEQVAQESSSTAEPATTPEPTAPGASSDTEPKPETSAT